jgi:hypothetical protein
LRLLIGPDGRFTANLRPTWTFTLASTPEDGPGIRMHGTENGKEVEYIVNKNGIRGGEIA